MITGLAASYKDVANEYYDETAHPTCANFRQLSKRFLGEYSRIYSGSAMLETGAGRSIAAEIITETGGSLQNLVLQDASVEMLQHSAEWLSSAKSHFVSDARQMPVQDASVDLAISSLADPYNDEAFLTEVSRILRIGGTFLLTVPSHRWAVEFREPEFAHYAEFVTTVGDLLYVPSITRVPEKQMALAREAGLVVRSFRTYDLTDLTGPISPKLFGATEVLDAFEFTKD